MVLGATARRLVVRSAPRIRSVLVLVAAVLVLAVGAASAPAAQWVGLGDSFAAGPLIPNQSLSPLGCLRSDHNVAHLAAAQLGDTLTDVSCSGATTDDMTAAQSIPGGTNPPQFDALGAGTRTVSLQIGGNDIGFGEILTYCTSLLPIGHPCTDHFVVGGVDTLAARVDATAPKIDAVLQGIHARSPDARILLIGYLPLLPLTGSGCWPVVPFTADDVPYIRSVRNRLNTMLATEAAANGAVYVDAYNAGAGKDACSSPLTRWVEPLVPLALAAPFHPNLRGMEGITPLVVAAAS
jgi:lysophospholipase L1-like esterase